MSKTIEIANWAEYFKEFSKNNFKRAVKMEVFGELGALEGVKKLPLAGVYVELEGANAPRAEILLGGISADEVEYLTHTISNVKSIMTLSSSEQTECAVEFVSEDGTKTLLSFEATTAETQTV